MKKISLARDHGVEKPDEVFSSCPVLKTSWSTDALTFVSGATEDALTPQERQEAPYGH
jgi:hypothetical protein